MTAAERVRYKRLPGRRRGVIRGASVWLGPDHLLLVRSMRFREEYKRFHLRDIQAIAVSVAPRFHISTRSLIIGLLWSIGLGVSYSVGPRAETALWIVGVALVVAWVYISANCSCVCRIYTAVSGDDLPSVYRSWTARRFMLEVEPLIAAAQGSAPGWQAADWVDELESRRIGPAEEQALPSVMGNAGVAVPAAPGARPVQASRLPLSEFFVAAMFADAILSYAQAHSKPAIAITWLGYFTLAVEIGLAVGLLVQRHRGRIGAAMQRVVIASLVATGITMYVAPIVAGVVAVASAGTVGKVLSPGDPLQGPAKAVLSDFDVAAHALLGLAGLGLVLAERGRKPGIVAGAS